MAYVATIGAFDGVHLGHRALLRRAVELAAERGVASAALTFNPHPRAVLSPDGDLKYLTTLEQRFALLRAEGISTAIALPFNRDVATLSAREFLAGLESMLDLDALVIGENFRIGKGREAGVDELRVLAKEAGWQVETVPPVQVEGTLVSSTRIREALRTHGDVPLAHRLLGRPYALAGVVVPGAGRGRTIGVPTANVRVPTEVLVPRYGVYYCRARLPGARAAESHGVLNIGIRPTFDAGARSVELHLLDWEGDLYEREITVLFMQRLRGEMKFEGASALVTQIQRDIERARLLAAPNA